MDKNDKLWIKLTAAIKAILNEGECDHSIDLYDGAYEIVYDRNYSESKVYDGIKEIIGEYLFTNVREKIFPINRQLIATIDQIWREYQKSISQIEKIFSHLSIIYIKPNKLLSISELSSKLFYENIINHQCLIYHIRDQLLLFILNEDNPNPEYKKTIRNVWQILMDFDLNIFDNHFEKPFRQHCDKFVKVS